MPGAIHVSDATQQKGAPWRSFSPTLVIKWLTIGSRRQIPHRVYPLPAFLTDLGVRRKLYKLLSDRWWCFALPDARYQILHLHPLQNPAAEKVIYLYSRICDFGIRRSVSGIFICPHESQSPPGHYGA